MASSEEKSDYSSDPLNFQTPKSVLSLSCTRIPRDFTITTDSYISLCSRMYAACCVESPDFADNVPESAFQYCAVILLWKRFVQVTSITPRESPFFKEINLVECSLYLPSPLLTYLKGIGHFRDPHDNDRHFVLPIYPMCEKIAGIPYTFGKVNGKTHHFYEAFPAPGIAALRMIADIRYTKDPCEKNLFWDLPEELRPDIEESQIESNKPTKNLLGWAPAQCLTVNQLKLLETAKVDDDFVKNNYTSSSISAHKLFELIHHELRQIYQYSDKGSWHELFGPLPDTGSLVQGMAIEQHDFFKFDRSAMYCEGDISVCSPYKLNDTLTKSALIAGYRMAKEPIRDRHCWSCYDFNEYKNVPDSWIRSRNAIYTFGRVASFNENTYSAGYISKRLLQNECILSSFKPKNWSIYK